MIEQLHISNYALIDKLDIKFDDGLTIITGETGAGKSIILGALSLILGEQNARKSETLISDCEFKDKDGITVVASLYVDDNNDLYELDIWKTDFSPLIEIPCTFC